MPFFNPGQNTVMGHLDRFLCKNARMLLAFLVILSIYGASS